MLIVRAPTAKSPVWTGAGTGISLLKACVRYGYVVVKESVRRRAVLRLVAGAKCFLSRALRKGAGTALPAALASLVFNVFVAQAMVVEGPSMRPNLDCRQHVIVEKITYGFTHRPRRGDVVIVDRPEESLLLVKRVVALAGETVAVQGGRVFINGQPLDEPWVTYSGGLDYPPTRVPLQHVFVLGDNREESRDSRFFGPVPVDQIGGQVRFTVWPPAKVGRIH